MTVVQDVLNLSCEFYHEISKPSPKRERDSLIIQINEFLAKREVLLKEMKGPYSQEEQQLGKELMECNHKIQAVLQSIQQEIQQDFLGVKNKKKYTPKYINPYTNIFNEGAYYDKKN